MKKVILVGFVLLVLITPVIGTCAAQTGPEAGLVTLEVFNPLAKVEIERIAPPPRQGRSMMKSHGSP